MFDNPGCPAAPVLTGLAPCRAVAAKEEEEEEEEEGCAKPTPVCAAASGDRPPRDEARGDPTPKKPPNELGAALCVGVGMGAVVECGVRSGNGPAPAAMAREEYPVGETVNTRVPLATFQIPTEFPSDTARRSSSP
jgi:hypothetical protein